MNIKNFEIKNFRSIKDETIEFNHNCLVLLGKNEAGKSNVLKAIASVFGKYTVTKKDRRKKIDNEKIDSEDYYVRCNLTLSEKDIHEIEKEFIKRFDIERIVFDGKTELEDVIKYVFKDLLIQINILENAIPKLMYWDKKLSNNYSFFTMYLNGVNNEIINEKEFDLLSELLDIIIDRYTLNPIRCHYWQYNESFLLPSSLEISNFITEPSKFKAVENIFQLCGRGNILKEFQDAINEDGDYSNLFEQISKQVTKTFQKIWADFKGTSIQLLPDGNQILIKIVEKAKYNCEDRSEGFKKFISILLMLSTQSRAEKIKENDIILIDEPDQSLYPSSAEFLRNELLHISKKSKIIYSTHSQYMIDTNNLERHIVVEKKDDITKLQKIDSNAPYTTDELLKRAIGSSIFECLKSVNIVFEGYLDKKLFDFYCQWTKKESQFSKFGKIYLKGVSGVDCIVSILDAANKKFIIVADSDSTSISKRIDFEKEHPDYKNNWLAYADVVQSASTMEDFLTNDLIESEIRKVIKNFTYDPNKNAIQNIEKAIGKDKDIKQDVKNSLIANLTVDNIKGEYYKFVEELNRQLNNCI